MTNPLIQLLRLVILPPLLLILGLVVAGAALVILLPVAILLAILAAVAAGIAASTAALIVQRYLPWPPSLVVAASTQIEEIAEESRIEKGDTQTRATESPS